MDEKIKVGIITGAGSGIGRAVAIRLCSDGWSIVLAGGREAQLMETAEACGGKRTLVVPTDINRQKSVKELFDLTTTRFGRLDLLFNNAAVTAHVKPIDDLSLEEWQRVIDTNLT